MIRKDNLDERLIEMAREVVADTLDELPAEIGEPVSRVSVFVELEPTHEDWLNGIGRDWLGIFEGAEHSYSEYPTPPRIRLWVRNLWDFASKREDRFREEVRVTLLHEIGHYLGLDEEGVARLGLE